jgi:arylsulfatase A-like enzyme
MKILLLEIAGLNLGYLGAYGNDWIATPTLDRLASESVVFDRHYAGGVSDLDTGRYRFPMPDATSPEAIPAAEFWRRCPEVDFKHLAPPEGTFASRWSAAIRQVLAAMTRAGDRSVLWAELPGLDPPWELPDDLLETYFDEEDEVAAWPDPPPMISADERALAHARLQNTYAAVMTFVDAQLGALVDKAASRLDGWLVCVTSRMGLPLGEHGHVGFERAWQHEELVHLPLIVRLPGAEHAGSRVAALTQPVDVLPTLLDVLGLEAKDVHGRSLLPLIRQEVSELREHACSGAGVNEGLEWSLRTRSWAYLLPLRTPVGDPPRRPQLYAKPEDRWEVNDVQQHHMERIAQMDRDLRAFVHSIRT